MNKGCDEDGRASVIFREPMDGANRQLPPSVTHPFRAETVNLVVGSSRFRDDCVKVEELIDSAEWRTCPQIEWYRECITPVSM